MRNRTKLTLILFSVSAVALALFAGCSGEMTAEEFLQSKDATDQVVTYYANGGTFDKSNSVVEKTIYYTADSYVIGDFENTNNISVAKTDNSFGGWYYAQTDSEGKPLKDDNGNWVVSDSDSEVDFTVKIKQGEHWYIYAKWIPNLKVDIKLVTEDKGAMHAKNGTEYENGAIISSKTFEKGNVAVIEANEKLIESTDYTFTQYFYDEACTQRVLEHIPMPEGENPENPVIYAKYIKGVWTMVRTPKDVQDMLSAASGKYYFCNMSKDKVIDCSSRTLRALNFDVCNAVIEGNGFTVENLNYEVTSVAYASGTYSVLGRLTQNAIVRDLTFDGINVRVTNSRQDISLYLLVSGVDVGATIENVAFKNFKLTVATNMDIKNIAKKGEEYVSDNWLLGGEANDAAFLAKYTGVTVENGTLLIGTGRIDDVAENGKEYTFPNA